MPNFNATNSVNNSVNNVGNLTFVNDGTIVGANSVTSFSCNNGEMAMFHLYNIDGVRNSPETMRTRSHRTPASGRAFFSNAFQSAHNSGGSAGILGGVINHGITNPPGDITIHPGELVPGGLHTGGNITITGATVGGAMHAGGTVTIKNGATVGGAIQAGGTVTIKNDATIGGAITAGGTVTIKNGATIVGAITAKEKIEINKSEVGGCVKSIADAVDILDHSTIKRDVTASRRVRIKDSSEVHGTVTSEQSEVVIDRSRVRKNVESELDIILLNGAKVDGATLSRTGRIERD